MPQRITSTDSSISSHSSNNGVNGSFDGTTSTSIPTGMNKNYYRQVPYRFFTNQSNTDACKLEKLTNLFPEMKATIELELFKINNLSRTIDRLSRIYTVLTALDIRDDTLHLFIGPYHISLGPALFAALHFKNASTALLIASHSAVTGGNESQRRRRRREAVLRRFRRAVRKLTLVKSIIDQLQPASVLTPYNQYELYSKGIYDLVLAGRIPTCIDDMFIRDDFLEQMHNFDAMTNAGERSPLLISNFVKINNLLGLLSSSQQQPQQAFDHSTMTNSGAMIDMKSNESIPNTTTNENNPNNAQSLINSVTVCCPQHNQNSPYIMYNLPRTINSQPSPYLSAGTRSRRSSNVNQLKTPSVLSRQSTANSLPDSATGDGSTSDLPLSTSPILISPPPSNSLDIELHTPTNINVEHPFISSNLTSSSPTINEEDALINRISSLLANHLLSRQTETSSTSITSHEHETNSNLSDSAISLSTSATPSTAINSTVLSNQSYSSINTNDFNQLLQRIKTAVDNRLSIERTNHNNNHHHQMRPPKNIAHQQELPSNSIRSATINRRQQLLALHAVSCQEAHTDDYDVEHSISSNRKHPLDFTSKSQSFDATHLNSHNVTTTITTQDTNGNHYQMTTLQSDEKGVQTDPRIRHARTKLLETLQAYITAVTRYRHHLHNQYTQSNTYYEQHYSRMPELQQYEYRDLINVRKEILNRFEWVINELEQTIENLESRRLTVLDAQERIDRPLVKEVIESSLNIDLPVADEQVHERRTRLVPSEDEWRMYTRDLQDTKEDLYFIDSLVHRGISKIDRLVNFTNLYT